jgi:hypothetical protein
MALYIYNYVYIQISWMAVNSSWGVFMFPAAFCSDLLMRSHKFSIIFKSGDWAGHVMPWMSLYRLNSSIMRARTCGDLRMRLTAPSACVLHIWGCITWYGVGTLCKVDGNINAVKYHDILDNHLWPVLVRHFADKPYRFLPVAFYSDLLMQSHKFPIIFKSGDWAGHVMPWMSLSRLNSSIMRVRWTGASCVRVEIFEWGLPPRVHVSAISEEGVCYDLGVHYMVWCGNFM